MNFALNNFSIMLIIASTFIFSYKTEPLEISSRVIHGKRAKQGQLPWQVILKNIGSEDSACGASLISSTWVLTAAHCISGVDEILLMFGSVSLINHTAPNLTSSEMYVHPNYIRANITDDIGLIKLPESVKFTKDIEPISLPPTSYEIEDFVGSDVTTSGFGLRDDKSKKFPKKLYYTDLKIISNQECAKELRRPIDNGTMCAKGEDDNKHASICNGDSGSAMVQKDDNGEWMQIGVNSFVASGMCTKGYPAGFARITLFLEWIANVTGIALK